jgi:hypothetical protein
MIFKINQEDYEQNTLYKVKISEGKYKKLKPYIEYQGRKITSLRVEGNLNPDNDYFFSGPYGIMKDSLLREYLVSGRGVIEAVSIKYWSIMLSSVRQGQKLYVACLWDNHGSVVLHTVGNPELRKYRIDRMPVLLRKNQVESWLNKNTPWGELPYFFSPFPAWNLKIIKE